MSDAPERTFWIRTPAGMMIEARPDAEDDDLVPVYACKRNYDALTAEVVRLRAENAAARLCLDFMAGGDDEAARMAKLAISSMDRAALRSTESSHG